MYIQVGAAGIGKVLQVIESNERMYSIPSSRSEQRSHLEDDILLTSLATGEAPPARLLATPPHLAYLKIAEGCRKRCTFCIIPIIKGPLRSKPIPQVCEKQLCVSMFISYMCKRQRVLLCNFSSTNRWFVSSSPSSVAK